MRCWFLSAVERLKSVLEPLAWVDSAWLYGSRARGQARPDSDWDIGILLSDSPPPQALEALHEAAEDAVAGEVSVAVLNQADTLLCREVIDGQILLRRRPETHAHFVSRVCRLAEDDQIRLRRGLRWWRERPHTR
ncbi:MAG: nucleotidyltransferase domain-containing protein [Candidatus Eremiobacteraeota bacterium]|nr:nucleotidyltransferase domain-containing protein [Candidatus Eremiobacteraeota bacterium]MCW5870265.1 nucleotidyltransferase domain-containing protein [Candidatus Eremiobacteraeota bacterium]